MNKLCFFVAALALSLTGCEDALQIVEVNLPKPSTMVKAIGSPGANVDLSLVFTTENKVDLDCASLAAAPHVKSLTITNTGSVEKTELVFPYIYRKTQTPSKFRLNLNKTYLSTDKDIDALVNAVMACRTDRNRSLTWSLSYRQV